LRMGLHSEALTAETLSDLSGTPRRGVDEARRVMLLGYGGHVLATAGAEVSVRRGVGPEAPTGKEVASLFHSAGMQELHPPRPEEVYNLYETNFGTSRPTRTRVPERVILRKKIPRTLKELR